MSHHQPEEFRKGGKTIEKTPVHMCTNLSDSSSLESILAE